MKSWRRTLRLSSCLLGTALFLWASPGGNARGDDNSGKHQHASPKPPAHQAAALKNPAPVKKEVKTPFWPFSIKDEERLFGSKGAGSGYRPNDTIYLWQRTIQEFSDKRQTITALTKQQVQNYGQLAQLDGIITNGNGSSHKMSRQDLLDDAEENEKKIKEISAGLMKLAHLVVRNATDIRKRLLGLRHKMDRAVADHDKKAGNNPKKKMDPRKVLEYKRQISDAVSLMETIEKDRKYGHEYLVNEMKRFYIIGQEEQEDTTPLADLFRAQVDAIKKSQQFLRYRLDKDERDLGKLIRILDKMDKRQEELKRVAEEKTVAAVKAQEKVLEIEKFSEETKKLAEADAEAREEAEEKAEEAEEKAEQEEQARHEAEKKTEEAEKKTEEAEKKTIEAEKEAQEAKEGEKTATAKSKEPQKSFLGWLGKQIVEFFN